MMAKYRGMQDGTAAGWEMEIMSSAYENAMSDAQANNHTQKYPVELKRKYCPDCGSLLPDEPHEDWCFCKPIELRTEAAEARAAQAEAERDAFAAENDAVHRTINEMCGTDTSTIEAVQHVIEQRDELRAKLEQAQMALRLLATDPITLGLSAHYRATCFGAYRESDRRIDPLANALNILGIEP